jgi:protein-disulfide isomerase
MLWTIPVESKSSQEVEYLKKEVAALKEGQAAIRRDLDELKTLLRGRQASRPPEPQNLILTVNGAPFMGDTRAALTLIEFSDYQCPFCARHVRETLPQIERDYIRTGKLKYVVRDFPMQSIHSQAFKGHEAARCAGDQGKYWEMHAQIIANQKALSLDDLVDRAQALKLDASVFRSCLDSGKHVTAIQMDMAEGTSAGVSGTPSFFLGLSEPNESKVKVVRAIRGAQPFQAFKEAIESLINAAPQAK